MSESMNDRDRPIGVDGAPGQGEQLVPETRMFRRPGSPHPSDSDDDTSFESRPFSKDGFPRLSAAEQQLVDARCDRFERLWIGGEPPPPLLPHLEDVPKHLTATVLAELIRVDAEMHRRGGLPYQRQRAEPHIARLPEDSREVVRGLLVRLVSSEPPTRVKKDGLSPVDGDADRRQPGEPDEDPPAAAGDQTVLLERNVPTFKDGRYKAVRSLGKGSFGIVWLAQDTTLGRDVAIKVPAGNYDDQASRDMFNREARAVAQLEHEGIVGVHDYGVEDSTAFIVFQYVPSRSLDRVLRRDGVTHEQAVRILASVAEAAHYAHEQDVVHRDIKPANILIASEDGRAVLADFGLAKTDRVADSLSGDGRIIGTPNYMAPEQARAESVTPVSEVFTLGVLLYELLSGRKPFDGESTASIVHQVVQDSPPLIRRLDSRIPIDLERICEKAMRKDPQLRYQSAGQLAEDLRRYERGEPVLARPLAFPKRSLSWCRRNKLSATLLLATVLASFTAVGMSLAPGVDNRVPVRFATTPAGAEVTVVRLDDELGEPDPETLVRLPGVSPVTTRLAGGRYLIVAVRQDEGEELKFCEQYLSVPNKFEGQDVSARRGNDGLDNGVFEDDHWTFEDPMVLRGDEEFSHLPLCEPVSPGIVPVRIEPAEASRATASDALPQMLWGLDDPERPIETIVVFAESELNDRGLRMPSVLEWDGALREAAEAVANDADLSPAGSVSLESLRWGVPEWTNTRVGDASFQGKAVAGVLPDYLRFRYIVAGGQETASGEGPPSMKGCYQIADANEMGIGYRGVRSVRPRSQPGDFVPLDEIREFLRRQQPVARKQPAPQ